MLEILRDLINRLIYTVRTRRYKSFDLCHTVVGIDEGRKSLGLYLVGGDLLCVVYDLLGKYHDSAHSCNRYYHDTEKKCLEKPYPDSLALHRGLGCNLFLLL